MKNLIKSIFKIIIIALLFTSCDPHNPATEGIDLPPINLGFKMYPDTAYIKEGETVTFSGSVSNILSNGVKIEKGQCIVRIYFGYWEQTPITEFGNVSAERNEHFDLEIVKGGVKTWTGTNKNQILDIYAEPYGDSLQVEFKFKMLKKGTYSLHLYSSFYDEKNIGKARTNPKFEMQNTHWDLWQVPNMPGHKAGEEGYYNSYKFAVIQ